jgi:colanic acid/amylovoran biosynthesis glycosyltransferase
MGVSVANREPSDKASAVSRYDSASQKGLSIAFLTMTFPVESETFISRKLDFLLQQGHDVHVFCREHALGVEHQGAWKGRIHCIPEPRFWKRYVLRTFVRYLSAWLTGRSSLKRLLELRRYTREMGLSYWATLTSVAPLLGRSWHLVHAHFLTALRPFLGLRYMVQCPIVASVYGFDATVKPYEPLGQDQLRAEIAQLDGVTYSSEFLRSIVHDLVATVPDEVILPPEVPINLFRQRQREVPHSPLRLLSVGRLHWAKGFVYGLAAVRQVVDEGTDCVYRIIGEGEARQEIEFAIRQLRLESVVRLDGAAASGEVAQAMDWADMLLLPSVKEEFGVVLIEAQASGLPIVATRVGGVPEAATDAVTATLVEPRDARALAEAVQKLAQDPARYSAYSLEGPKHAKRFNSARIGAELLDFYSKVMASPRGRLVQNHDVDSGGSTATSARCQTIANG